MTDLHMAIAMVLVLIAGWLWIAGPEGVPDDDDHYRSGGSWLGYHDCPWPGECECTEKCERREK